MRGPLLILHETTGQPASCLDGLVYYAREIAKTAEASALTEDELLSYLWLSPVVFDDGQGPQVTGCRPAQRSRIWPRDLNCWEATAHFAGWAIAQQVPIEVHLFQAYVGKMRHVFPAWRYIGDTLDPVPLLLQPPVSEGADLKLRNLTNLGLARTIREGRAQAWYNTVADVAHAVGSVVLGVFGAGAAVPLVEEAWKQAPEEYGLTKFKKTASAEEVADAKAKADAAKAVTAVAVTVATEAAKKADDEKKPSGEKTPVRVPPPPPANALIVPDGRGGYRNYGPPIG